MKVNRQTFWAIVLGGIVGVGSFAAMQSVSTPARAADGAIKLDDAKWSTGDRARDVLDHLKKAEEEIKHVAKDEDSKVARDAADATSTAREKTDTLIAELDKKGR
jgi:hypothetical protein